MAIPLVAFGLLLGLVQGQGFYLEPVTCDASQNWVDLGCYDTTTQPFTYAIQNGWNGEDPSRSHANYNRGGNVINSTNTPYFCVQACRAHGFRYTSLYNRECRCGSVLGTNFFNKRSADQTCYSQALSVDPVACGGDNLENCGNVTAMNKARIFVDPSFEAEQNPATVNVADIAASYGYLGCFNKPNMQTDDPNKVTQQTTIAACLQQCARYGYPLAYGTSWTLLIRCVLTTNQLGSKSINWS